MTPVATAPAPSRRASRSTIVRAIVAAALAVAVLVAVAPQLRLPATVDAITVRNPHPWIAAVSVSDDGRDGRLGLGSIPRQAEYSFHEVIDQGGTWVFTFAYAGIVVETAIPRADLQRDGWVVTVPDDLAIRLRAAGVVESAPGTG
jgi:hypothetical protein